MPFVLDASATLEAFLEDEGGAVGDLVLLRLDSEQAIAPAVWTGEVVNAIGAAVRSGRVEARHAHVVLGAIAEARIDVVADVAPSRALLEAMLQTGLTAHDASYLLLAVETGLALATCDRWLRTAAEHAGIACL